jgi:hypothetical protein
MFRVGKQIISWGQTDGFRLMDQINPLDQRRGFADVEFETTIIPISLVRADYAPKVDSTWLQDLKFQVWFNPNIDFIPSQEIRVGNNKGGIWSPNIVLGTRTFLGSFDIDVEKPSGSNGFEYGGKIDFAINNTIFTVNGFYGRDTNFVREAVPAPPRIEIVDGNVLIHPKFEAHYPRFRFVGMTLTRDLDFLQSAMHFFGGYTPVLRMEGLYGFNSTFFTNLGTLEVKDELRVALGLDWKVKIPFLNPVHGFSIGPQVYYHKIFGFPDTPHGLIFNDSLKRDSWMTTLFLSTAYMNERLTPSVFWLFDVTNKAWFIKPQVSYIFDKHWTFTVGAMFLSGQQGNMSFQLFEHKDYIFFKALYKWG